MNEASGTPARQIRIYLDGVRGARPKVPVDAVRLEAAAKHALSKRAYAYLAGGAGSESTMRANREAFDRWRIVPRMMRDVSVRNIRISLFGRMHPTPFFLSPIGVLELMHAKADIAVARAAASLGVPMVMSNQASVPMEKCAAAMGDAPRWFQLYWSKDDDLVISLLERAEECGCSAIIVTLDTTYLGWRPRDLDWGYLPFMRGQGIAQYTSDPVFMNKLTEPLTVPAPPPRRMSFSALRTAVSMARAVPGGTTRNLRKGIAIAAVRRFIATYSRPSLTWDDLDFLKRHTRLPLVLKGILHPDDARRAVDAGADGVIVSNHGGRQVDGAIASLDALPRVVDAVGDRVPVLFDSGIRTGADAFRALALGAHAVGVGRPYAYGLAINGEAGVREVMQNLLAEFELTLSLAGCRSVHDADRGSLAHQENLI